MDSSSFRGKNQNLSRSFHAYQIDAHNQIEFVTLICILLWDGRTNERTDERTSRNISIDMKINEL